MHAEASTVPWSTSQLIRLDLHRFITIIMVVIIMVVVVIIIIILNQSRQFHKRRIGSQKHGFRPFFRQNGTQFRDAV